MVFYFDFFTFLDFVCKTEHIPRSILPFIQTWKRLQALSKNNVLVVLRPQARRRFAVLVCQSSVRRMHEYKTGEHRRILLPPPILAKPCLAWRTTCVIAPVRGLISSCHHHVKPTLELSIRLTIDFQMHEY